MSEVAVKACRPSGLRGGWLCLLACGCTVHVDVTRRPRTLEHECPEVLPEPDVACPFCGSHDLDCGLDANSIGYTVTCMNCMAAGPTLLDGDDDAAKPYSPEVLIARAWELWNRRPPQEPRQIKEADDA